MLSTTKNSAIPQAASDQTVLNHSLSNMRKEYHHRELDESTALRDPFQQFRRWFEDAAGADFEEPNAMALATADGQGRPAVRMVLLKSFDERGFVFFSNYKSRKGRELTENPRAALLFWWEKFDRQVRIEGAVEKISAEESEAYFRSRPLGSRLGAWASEQSAVISGRAELEGRLREVTEKFRAKEVPRPPYWGGYRVIPEIFEFWQGRESRLHDRLRYRKFESGEWLIERLSP